MRYRILKQFTGNGRKFERGEEVELEPSVRLNTLTQMRFILPLDPLVAQATESPVADIETAQARRGRPRTVQPPTGK